MKKIAVIGAGTMGNGIAHVFAQAGFKVNLVDISQEALDRAISIIQKNMDRQIAKGRLSEEEKNQSLGNITSYTEMETALSDRELIVEAATENDDLKLKIFEDIVRDLNNYDLEFRIQELESKFSKDLSETTFNELKELKKKQNIN